MLFVIWRRRGRKNFSIERKDRQINRQMHKVTDLHSKMITEIQIEKFFKMHSGQMKLNPTILVSHMYLAFSERNSSRKNKEYSALLFFLNFFIIFWSTFWLTHLIKSKWTCSLWKCKENKFTTTPSLNFLSWKNHLFRH